jgi:hypothetical protein
VVLGGKLEAGRTELKIDVIFPVSKEITMVADVTRPDITALEETKTVNAGVAGSTTPLGGDRGGVG